MSLSFAIFLLLFFYFNVPIIKHKIGFVNLYISDLTIFFESVDMKQIKSKKTKAKTRRQKSRRV